MSSSTSRGYNTPRTVGTPRATHSSEHRRGVGASGTPRSTEVVCAASGRPFGNFDRKYTCQICRKIFLGAYVENVGTMGIGPYECKPCYGARKAKEAEERKRREEAAEVAALQPDGWSRDPAGSFVIWHNRLHNYKDVCGLDENKVAEYLCRYTGIFTVSKVPTDKLEILCKSSVYVRRVLETIDFELDYTKKFHQTVLEHRKGESTARAMKLDASAYERAMAANCGPSSTGAAVKNLHALYMEAVISNAAAALNFVRVALSDKLLARWTLKELAKTSAATAATIGSLSQWCMTIRSFTPPPAKISNAGTAQSYLPEGYHNDVVSAWSLTSGGLEACTVEEVKRFAAGTHPRFSDYQLLTDLAGFDLQKHAQELDADAKWNRFKESVAKIHEFKFFLERMKSCFQRSTKAPPAWITDALRNLIDDDALKLTEADVHLSELLRPFIKFKKSRPYLEMRSDHEDDWLRAVEISYNEKRAQAICEKVTRYPTPLDVAQTFIRETERVFRPESKIEDVVDFFSEFKRVSPEVQAKRQWVQFSGDLRRLFVDFPGAVGEDEDALMLRKYLWMDSINNVQFEDLHRFLKKTTRIDVTPQVIDVARLWLSTDCNDLRSLALEFEGKMVLPQLLSQSSERKLVSNAISIIRTMPAQEDLMKVLSAASLLQITLATDSDGAEGEGEDRPTRNYGLEAIHLVREKGNEVRRIVSEATSQEDTALSGSADLRSAQLVVQVTRDMASILEDPTESFYLIRQSRVSAPREKFDINRLDKIYHQRAVNCASLNDDQRVFQETFPRMRNFVELAHSCLREGFLRFTQYGSNDGFESFRKLHLERFRRDGFVGFSISCDWGAVVTAIDDASADLADLVEQYHQARSHFCATCPAAQYLTMNEIGLLTAGEAGATLLEYRLGQRPQWTDVPTDVSTSMTSVFAHLAAVLDPCTVDAPHVNNPGLTVKLFHGASATDKAKPTLRCNIGSWTMDTLQVFADMVGRLPFAYEVAMPGGPLGAFEDSIYSIVRRASSDCCPTCSSGSSQQLFVVVVPAEVHADVATAVKYVVESELHLRHDVVLLLDHRIQFSSNVAPAVSAAVREALPPADDAESRRLQEKVMELLSGKLATSLPDLGVSDRRPRACKVIGAPLVGKSRKLRDALKATDGGSKDMFIGGDSTPQTVLQQLTETRTSSSALPYLIVQAGCTATIESLGILFSLLVFRGVLTSAGDAATLPRDTCICVEVPQSTSNIGLFPALCTIRVGAHDPQAPFSQTEKSTKERFRAWYDREVSAGRLNRLADANMHLLERTALSISYSTKKPVGMHDEENVQATTDLPSAAITWDCDRNPMAVILNDAESPFQYPEEGTTNLPLPDDRREWLTNDTNSTWRTLNRALGQRVDANADAPPGLVITPSMAMAIARLDLCFRSRCCPVVLVGGTGVGKTFLIERVFCRIRKVQCRTITVDASVTPETLNNWVIEQKKAVQPGKAIVWFLDEVNTTPCQDAVKRLLVERSILTKQGMVRVPEEVFLCAACNPYETDSKGRALYSVQPVVHPSLRAFCWRVHEPHGDEIGVIVETVARSPIKNKFEREAPPQLLPPAVMYLKAIVPALHRFGEEHAKEIPTSLRNVDRAVRLTSNLPSICRFHGEDMSSPSDYVVLAVALSYYVSLAPEQRRTFGGEQHEQAVLEQVNKQVVEYQNGLSEPAADDEGSELHKAYEGSKAYKLFRPLAEVLEEACNRVLEVFTKSGTFMDTLTKTLGGPLIESHVRENLGLVFMCAAARVPLLLIGAPGTSKSLAVHMLASGISQDIRTANPHLQSGVMAYYCQGSSFITSRAITSFLTMVDEIEKTSRSDGAAGANAINLRVFDELGHAQDAPGAPLKTLNAALERPTSFVATSNIGVDRSVINRCIVVQCNSAGQSGGASDKSRTLEELFQDHPMKDAIVKDAARRLGELDKALLSRHEVSHSDKLFGLRDLFALARDSQFMEGDEKEREQAAVRCLGTRYNVFFDARMTEKELNAVNFDILYQRLEEIKERKNADANHKRQRPLYVEAQSFVDVLELLRRVLDVNDVTHICGVALREDYGLFHLLMIQLRQAMEQGKLVVLSRCEMLYDSLFDVFNGHYQEMNGFLFVRVIYEGKSHLWKVHKSFRLMIVDALGDSDSGTMVRVRGSASSVAFMSRFEQRQLFRSAMVDYLADMLDPVVDPLSGAHDHVTGYHPFMYATLKATAWKSALQPGTHNAPQPNAVDPAMVDLLHRAELRQLRIPQRLIRSPVGSEGTSGMELTKELRAVVKAQDVKSIVRATLRSRGSSTRCILCGSDDELRSVTAAQTVHEQLMQQLIAEKDSALAPGERLPARFISSDTSDLMLQFVLLKLCRTRRCSLLYICGEAAMRTTSLFSLCQYITSTVETHNASIILVVKPPVEGRDGTPALALPTSDTVQMNFSFAERLVHRLSETSVRSSMRELVNDKHKLPERVRSAVDIASSSSMRLVLPPALEEFYAARLSAARETEINTHAKTFLYAAPEGLSAQERLQIFDEYVEVAAEVRGKMALHLTNLAATRSGLLKFDEVSAIAAAMVKEYGHDDEGVAKLPPILPPRLDASLPYCPYPGKTSAYWDAVAQLIEKKHDDRHVANCENDASRLSVMRLITLQRQAGDEVGVPVRNRNELLVMFTMTYDGSSSPTTQPIPLAISEVSLNTLRAIGPRAITADVVSHFRNSTWLAVEGEYHQLRMTEKDFLSLQLRQGSDRRPRVRNAGKVGRTEDIVELYRQRLRLVWPDVAMRVDIASLDADALRSTQDRSLRHFLLRWEPDSFRRIDHWFEDDPGLEDLADLAVEQARARAAASPGDPPQFSVKPEDLPNGPVADLFAIRGELAAAEAKARGSNRANLPRLAAAARVVLEFLCGHEDGGVMTEDMANELQLKHMPRLWCNYVMDTLDGILAEDNSLLDALNTIYEDAATVATRLMFSYKKLEKALDNLQVSLSNEQSPAELNKMSWLEMTVDDQIITSELVNEVLVFGDEETGDLLGRAHHLREVLTQLACPAKAPDVDELEDMWVTLRPPATAEVASTPAMSVSAVSYW